MIKGQLSRVFDLEADDRLPTDTQHSPNPLRLPTLDDRVTLYLCAIHGMREFSSEEYSTARNIILDSMAANVGVKQEISFSEEDTPTHPADISRHHFASAMLDHRHDDEAPSSQLVIVNNSIRRSSGAGTDNRRIRLTRTVANRTIGMFATIAAVVVLVVITIYPSAWIGIRPDTSKTSVIALTPSEGLKESPPVNTPASSPGVKPSSSIVTAVEARSDRKYDRIVSAGGGNMSQQDQRQTVIDPVKRGNELIAAGDITAARLVLSQAADEGDAPAALALGATFDPIEIEKWGRREFSPDIAMARSWYGRAQDLGSTEAPGRLQRLEGRDR